MSRTEPDDYGRGFIEHQLVHSVKDLLGRAYNLTKHLDQHRRMKQVRADFLDGLKAQSYFYLQK
ncbi:hypothetical protein KAI46_08305 [bacterium]|nr:hypothetical protein [bacterium]